jgi:photosystem II stability/assembly factor-like uncharacterized protein
MKKWFFILGIATIAIFILFSDSFGDTRWKQIDPEGGFVDSLAINPQSPDTIYAGTTWGGVFKSTNGGRNWNAMSSGLTNLDIWSLAINPQSPDTIYAGTEGSSTFKTQEKSKTMPWLQLLLLGD